MHEDALLAAGPCYKVIWKTKIDSLFLIFHSQAFDKIVPISKSILPIFSLCIDVLLKLSYDLVSFDSILF